MDTGFVEFQQLQEVGVFSYFVYFQLKSHLKWFGWCEAVSGHLVGPKNLGLNAEIFGTHFGQSRTTFGLKMVLVCLICVLLLDN